MCKSTSQRLLTHCGCVRRFSFWCRLAHRSYVQVPSCVISLVENVCMVSCISVRSLIKVMHLFSSQLPKRYSVYKFPGWCICKVHYLPQGYPGAEQVCLVLPPAGWLIEKPGLQLLAEFKERGGGSEVDWKAVSCFRDVHISVASVPEKQCLQVYILASPSLIKAVWRFTFQSLSTFCG